MKTPDWLEVPTQRSWQRLLEVGSNGRSLFRVTKNEPQMIAPPIHGDRGIWSDDARMTRLQIEAADTLSSLQSLQPQIDSHGFAGPNAIIGDFQSLRNRSGFYMNPISVPMMSNTFLAKDLDLATGFLSERDERIFRALHSYMFRTVVPASMPIRKTASSGSPYFTSALDEKKIALAVFNEHAPDILARFGSGDLEGLYDDYAIFMATYMGVRTQPDSVKVENGHATPKPREANDGEFSRSGGKSGRRQPADKTIRNPDGSVVDGIFAMRRRSVYAYPAMYNYFITQFFTPLRAFYLSDAEYTYKHRDPESISEKLRAFESVKGYDVKQFDQSIQPWLLDAFVDGFNGFIKEEVLFFLRSILRQPIYVPHPEVINASGHEKAPHRFNPFLGDPFDLSSFNLDVGLPSGVGPNPDMGKFFMTFAYLCLFDRHFHDVLEVGVQTILRGRHERYALLDMGDDAVLAVNDDSFWATAERVLREKYYVRIEAEHGISFLGNVLYKDQGGILRATSNVITFVRNRLCPEHGVQHWSRRAYAGTGWFEGKKHYSTAPMFGEVLTVWDDLWRKHFGEGMDVRFYAAREAERHRNVPSLSEADRAVLENPDKLYYRYSIEEIHPWVLDRLIGAVEFETYFPFIERFFV